MATRATLRADVRSRIADPAGGLWSDLDVNTALARAAADIGARFPEERATPANVAAGAVSVPLPAGARELLRIVLPSGAALERGDTPGDPLSWSVWGSLIHLSRAVRATEAGSWSLRLLANRVIPASDVTVLTFSDDLCAAIAARAGASLIRSRLADDARRNRPSSGVHLMTAQALDTEAETIIRAQRRRARGGTLS